MLRNNYILNTHKTIVKDSLSNRIKYDLCGDCIENLYEFMNLNKKIKGDYTYGFICY